MEDPKIDERKQFMKRKYRYNIAAIMFKNSQLRWSNEEERGIRSELEKKEDLGHH